MASITLSELIMLALSLEQVQALVTCLNINVDNYLGYLKRAEIHNVQIYSYDDYCSKISDITDILKYYMPEDEFNAFERYMPALGSFVLDTFNSIS